MWDFWNEHHESAKMKPISIVVLLKMLSSMIYSKENRILFPSSRIQTMLQTHSETTFSTEAEQSIVLLDETGKGGVKNNTF